MADVAIWRTLGVLRATITPYCGPRLASNPFLDNLGAAGATFLSNLVLTIEIVN